MTRKNKAMIITLAILSFFSFYLIVFSKIIFESLSHGITVSSFFYSLGRLSGLIGLLLLSLLIFSGDTARFFDRFFGMDRIINLQRKSALITLVFVLLHPTFFMLANKSILNYMIPNFAAMPLAFGILGLYLFVAVMTASLLYKMVPYAIWQYIHILTYAILISALYHATNIGQARDLMPTKITYFAMTGLVAAGAAYRTSYKIKQRHLRFNVKEIRPETYDAFTLALEPNRKFPFKPGQFCFLRLEKEGLYARHPFTISSAPNEKEIRFTMKLKGRFVNAASKLNRGDEVKTDGPFGIFTIEDKTRDLVFIAGGIGITPFMSMIRNQLKTGDKQNITLLYGAKTEKDLVFKDEIDDINKEWFKKTYVLSTNNQEGLEGYETGHINEKIIKERIKNMEDPLFYICGPEPMKESCERTLLKLGVNKQDIITESFFW